MRNHSSRLLTLLAFVVILVAGAALRLYNLNWDRDQHLHPDERYLTMVVSAVRFPGEGGGDTSCEGPWSCLSLYWQTDASPLNPANYPQYSNYVYGTLPLFTTRAAARWVDRACAPDSGSSSPAPVASWVARTFLSEPEACRPGHYTGYGGIHLVGRGLSTLADLATLLGLMLLAYALYGSRVSVLSGAFYAAAVLPIQHAHFFVVDSFASVFVMWTLLFSVLSQRWRRPLLLLPAGLLTGLAVASKASVWPLALMVGAAGFIQLWNNRSAGMNPLPDEVVPDKALPDEAAPVEGLDPVIEAASPSRARRDLYRVLFALAWAGVLAAVAFRAGQPYAFTGPGFLDVGIKASWMATMREIQELMRGMRDVPFGHQWTARTPVIFPWRNMVFWGLGLPLGLMAWAGWLWMGWQTWRRRQWEHLIPWVWGTLFFLYQSTQWVKSMRYLLPIYPVFAMFAAWALVRLLHPPEPRLELGLARDNEFRRRLGVVSRMAGIIALPMVLGGTLLWSLAFLSIYSQPVTRVEASRWIYENVPTAIQVRTTDGQKLNVPYSPDVLLSPDSSTLSALWTVPRDAEIDAVVLPKAMSGGAGTASGVLVASLAGRTAQSTVTLAAQASELVRASEGAPASSYEGVEVVLAFDPPVTVSAGETLELALALAEGAPVRLQTSVLANEHWDDGLPLRVDGRDGFWNWYRGLTSSPSGQMNNYDNDTLEKRAHLLDWLEEADYIMLSSNRLYGSIPRLPARYPLTTEYYRLLFNGALGFELAAEFVSYPALGPCQFPDQENPFPLMTPLYTNARACSIPFPPAEEAFSVYDHPTVLIFRKAPGYSRARAEVLLPASLVDNVRWMTPRQATLGSSQRAGALQRGGDDSLLMTARMRLQQEAGGTWSALFNRDAVQNAAPLAGALLWVLMLSVIGWIAFPLVYVVLPALRYRGYGMSRMLGLLIWVYAAWLLASLRVLPYTRTVLWVLLLVFAAISAWVGYRNRDGLRALITEHWRSLVTMDLIFIGLYLVWVAYRGMNPDLWHPAMGGEKPMDFAYLNAVVKSTWFPPYDPWFAGGTLNYYYFGFVLMGSLVKLLGIIPSIAYNLAIPTLFALTGLGAYTLADTLAGGDSRRGFRAGIWAVIFVLIIGNLGEARMLYHGFVTVGGVDFESLIPGYPQFVSALVGFWKVVGEGVRLPFRSEWWYWNATRIIPVLEGEVGPINEFPAFTFIYADLHAHAMALPLTQAALAFALQWGLGAAGRIEEANPEKRWDRVRRWFRAALPTPIASLLVGALVAGSLRATNTWDYPTYLILMTVAFLTGSVVREFLLERRSPGQIGRLLAGLLTPVLLLALAELLFRPFSAAYQGAYAAFEAWEGSRTPAFIYLLMYGMFLFPIVVVGLGRLITHALRYRRAAAKNIDALLWPIAVALTLAVALVLLVGYYRASIAWIAVPVGGLALLLLTTTDTPLTRRILWFWTGSALALSLLVEVLVLKGDIGRMNTVFKFHLQVWMLLGLTAAVFFERLIHGSRGLGARISPDAAEPARPALSHDDTVPGQGGGPDAHFVEVPPEGASLPQAQVPAPDGLPVRNDPQDRDDESVSPGEPVARDEPAAAAEVLRLTVLGAAGALIFLAALYPLFAIPGRIRDRWVPSAPQTLDGMTYMLHATHYERETAIPLTADYEIIRWLQDNVEGSPTIMETVADREYLWGNRISIYTGLPSVAGWRWHQVQQRMVMPSGTVETRHRHIRSFYNTRSPEQAREILDLYHVRYVILAPYERAYIEPEGLPKFEVMVEWGWLEVVYQSDQSTIFRVVD